MIRDHERRLKRLEAGATGAALSKATVVMAPTEAEAQRLLEEATASGQHRDGQPVVRVVCEIFEPQVA